MNSPNLPAELIDKCRRGGTLLVRGSPGSGKTIFALSMARHLSFMGLDITYISTRLSAPKLLESTPISKDLGADSIVDSSLRRSSDREPEVKQVHMTDLSDLAMLLLQRSDDNSVVVLDSWDAILQRDKRPDEEVYSAALDLINRTPGSMILTMERDSNQNPLQHIADAQVTLERQTLGDHGIRVLKVDKLRGSRIDNPCYVFTLSQGRFTAYDPSAYDLRKKPIGATTIPRAMQECKNKYSSGMCKLDDILVGGYTYGSHVVMEVDLEAPAEVFDMSYLPMAADFLVKERPVIVIPPCARDVSSIWETASSILEQETWAHMKSEMVNDHVRVLSFGSRSDDEFSVTLGGSLDEDLSTWNKSKKEMKYRFNKRILGIVGYDTLSRIYPVEEVKSSVARILAGTRASGDLTLSIVTDDLQLKRHLLGLSDYYFRIKLFNGVPIFSGVKPRTHPFALSLTKDKGVPNTDLHELV